MSDFTEMKSKADDLRSELGRLRAELEDARYKGETWRARTLEDKIADLERALPAEDQEKIGMYHGWGCM